MNPMRHFAGNAGSRALSLVVGLAVLLCTSLSQAAPSASCTARCATRTGTTCTAPAYVHVDCIGEGTNETTDSDTNVRPFHDLRYEIDYGDAACSSGQGAWANSDLKAAKNTDQSAIGAHVYECAGTFTITTTVTDSTGATSQTTDSVTIEAEDVGWSGANTRCVANGSTPVAGVDGCPAGATSLLNSADFDSSVLTGAGKRTLFKCGDTFTIDAEPNLSDASSNGSLIGGYGSCAGNPVRIDSPGSASRLTDGDLDGWRLRDLRFTALAPIQYTQIISTAANVSKLLLLRVETLNVGMCSYLGLEWNQMTWNELNAYVSYKCTLVVHHAGSWPTSYGLGGRYAAFIDSLWIVGDPNHLLGDPGNTVTAANGMRLMGANHFFFSHSRWEAYDGANLTLQFRSASNETGRHSRWNVISDLRLYDDGTETFRQIATCSYHACGTGASQGQLSHVDTELGEFIFENIHISYGPNKQDVSQWIFKIGSANTTVRNNIVDMHTVTSDNTTYFAGIDGPDVDLISPDNMDVYNNTLIRGGQHNSACVPCNAAGQTAIIAGTGHRCRNNLIYETEDSDNSGPAAFTCPGCVQSNNVHLNAGEEGCPFAGNDGNCTLSGASPNFDFTELQIRDAGGSRDLVYNAGFTFPEPSGRKSYVYNDSFLGCRGTSTGGPDNAWDIGANEATSDSCAPSLGTGGSGGGGAPGAGGGASGSGNAAGTSGATGTGGAGAGAGAGGSASGADGGTRSGDDSGGCALRRDSRDPSWVLAAISLFLLSLARRRNPRGS